MISPETLVFSLIGASIVLMLVVEVGTSITTSREGKIIAFLALFIVPVRTAGVGASEHIERSEQTQFCLSCHIMERYGKSLYVDDPAHIPAAHFHTHRTPADQA